MCLQCFVTTLKLIINCFLFLFRENTKCISPRYQKVRDGKNLSEICSTDPLLVIEIVHSDGCIKMKTCGALRDASAALR